MATIRQTATVYDDIPLMSSWKEEEENNVLLVHLPKDFTKEQIKITCVRSSRVVRVQGERQIANNKWSRFNQAFPVPQNCKIDKIHAKWENGTLAITMPKETITVQQQVVARKQEEEATKTTTQLPPAQKPEKDQPMSQKGMEETSSKHKMPENIVDPLRPQKPEKDQQQPMSQKGTEETSSKHKKPEKDHQAESMDKKSAETFSKFKRPAEMVDQMNLKELFTKTDLKNPENVKEKLTMVKESVFGKAAEKEKGKKDHKSAGEEDQKHQKDSAVAAKAKETKSKASATMKAVKGFMMENNEERQLMVNMGVAVLVIVALGAYVSYSFSSKTKN